MRNATPSLEELDSKIQRSWLRLLKASSTSEIDKQMDLVDSLLDQRLLLTGAQESSTV